MPKVTIRIEDGPPGFGPLSEITVRAATTAGALSQALAAVLPRAGVSLSDLVRETRLERQRIDAGAARMRAAAPAGAPGPFREPVRLPLPVIDPVALAALGDRLSKMFAHARASLAGARLAGPRVGQAVTPPPGAARTRLLVLPDEARDWNAQHPGSFRMEPGSRDMTPDEAGEFLAWRAVRAESAPTVAPTETPGSPAEDGPAGPT